MGTYRKIDKYKNRLTIDLHNLTLKEAQEKVAQFLKSCLTKNVKYAEIITGSDNHNNSPVLQSSIPGYVKSLGYTIIHDSVGSDGCGTISQAYFIVDLEESRQMIGKYFC